MSFSTPTVITCCSQKLSPAVNKTQSATSISICPFQNQGAGENPYRVFIDGNNITQKLGSDYDKRARRGRSRWRRKKKSSETQKKTVKESCRGVARRRESYFSIWKHDGGRWGERHASFSRVWSASILLLSGCLAATSPGMTTKSIVRNVSLNVIMICILYGWVPLHVQQTVTHLQWPTMYKKKPEVADTIKTTNTASMLMLIPEC